MLKTHAVGIDLGTTYSCIAHLNEHGEPVTLANQEGELTTPSVVLIDDGEAVVGTEALRNAIVRPDRIIQSAKRWMGDPRKHWVIDGKRYTPIDSATLIVKKLLSAAEEKLGKIEQAVITVPAQFSEIQRQATVEAGLKAGLRRVDIINEPVAAALCYVLGTEGLWFTELADEQRILVYDLGGGTFDLSVVKYHKNEVRVIASAGDLNLGGLDWNKTLQDAIAGQFVREFGTDPRDDAHSAQFLALEVENTKRALSVRPKAALTVQHDGNRKTYQVEQTQFERLTQKLVDRTSEITQTMLKENKLTWGHIDVILTAGGSSRMPMIRNALKKIGGRTLNTSLSPDLSIAHGATYYAGMLLTNNDFAKSILSEKASARLASFKQQNVNARGLGILVRDEKNERVPHYLIPANTPLPAEFTQSYGTVHPNQKRVHLRIVESGTAGDQQFVELGTCVIEGLPPNLPENSLISVTISYDDQARVHVSAKDVTSGKVASTTIVREENLLTKDVAGITSGTAEGNDDWHADDLKLRREDIDPKKSGDKWTVAGTNSSKSSGSVPAVKPSVAVKPAAVAAPKAVAGSKPIVNTGSKPIVDTGSKPAAKPTVGVKPAVGPRPVPAAKPVVSINTKSKRADDDDDLEGAGRPVPLCNECGEPLDGKGRCLACALAAPRSSPALKTGSKPAVRPVATASGSRPSATPTSSKKPVPSSSQSGVLASRKPSPPVASKGGPSSAPKIPIDDDEILELALAEERTAKKPATKTAIPVMSQKPTSVPKPTSSGSIQKPSVKAAPVPKSLDDKPKKPGLKRGGLADSGEDEFFKLSD